MPESNRLEVDTFATPYAPKQQILTEELLLALTQGHKHATVKRAFVPVSLLPTEIKVTEEDIEIMADSLKFTAYYVPAYVYAETMKLAHTRGVLVEVRPVQLSPEYRHFFAPKI